MLLFLYIWSTHAAENNGPAIFSFFEQPQSQRASEGSLVTLSCRAGYGGYPVRHSWYRSQRVQVPPDITNKVQHGGTELTVNISRSDSRQLFQCCAESEGSKIYSDVAKVTVSYFEFTGESVDGFVTISDAESAVAAALSCSEQLNHVSSDSPFDITWYKGNRDISDMDQFKVSNSWISPRSAEIKITIGGSLGEISLLKVDPYDLVVYNLQLTDSATFFCKAVQGDQKILLATWTLQVNKEFADLKYFISQPVVGYLTTSVDANGKLNNEPLRDGKVTLWCGGVGWCYPGERLSYTWYREGRDIVKGKKIEIDSSEFGRYQCAVRCDTFVTDKTPVIVPRPVGDTPKVEFLNFPPIYRAYIVGTMTGSIDIPCSITDNSQFRRAYYLNGVEIDIPITVPQAALMNTGAVQCSFVDKLTQSIWIQRTTQVAIIGKPEIESIFPEDILVGNTLHVFEGSTVSFAFKVKCHGPVQVRLLTDGKDNPVCKPLPGAAQYILNDRCTVSEDGVYNITIEGFSLLNERTYTVEVTNEYYLESFGETYNMDSFTVRATVHLILVEECKANIALAPMLKTYSFGKQVALTCRASGYPVPVVQFYKDKQPLGLWESSCRRSIGEITCSLPLNKYSDSGQYSCIVYNEIRRSVNYCNTTSYSVAFVGDPTVTSLSLREANGRTLAVCTVEGNPPPTDVYWVNNTDQRVESSASTETVSNFRVVSSLNISSFGKSPAWPYLCCMQDGNYNSCKEILPEDDFSSTDSEIRGSFWERQEKIYLGLIIGGSIAAVILVVIGFFCYRRWKKNRKDQYRNIAEVAGRDNGHSEMQAKPTKGRQPRTDSKESTPQVDGKKTRGRDSKPADPAYVRVRPVSNPRYAQGL